MLSGYNELRRAGPAGTGADPQGDGADAWADVRQMLVHGLAADGRHDQAGTARRAVFDKLRWRRPLRRPFQQASPAGTFGWIRPSEPPVAPDARARAARGPDAGQRAVAFQPGRTAPRGPGREALSNGAWRVHPETRFRPAGKLPRDRAARQFSEVFLKACCAARPLWGYTGRPGMRLM
jgi:hypothetical protein